jgi:activating signal cointegrator complex subunit 3
MEEALVLIEKERLQNSPNEQLDQEHRLCPREDFLQASSDFVRALQELAEKISIAKDDDYVKSTVTSAPVVVEDDTAIWLYNLVATVPSPLDVLTLSVAILNACKLEDEMQIQSSLFDTLGESERALEVLFQIVPRAREISSSVTEENLRKFHTTGTSVVDSSIIPEVDPEMEALDQLRRDAMEKAQYVALLRAELGIDEDTRRGPSKTTHTVKRTSDKAAMKMLERAEKQAAAALAAAKEVGAIIDDNDEQYDASALMDEAINRNHTGLHRMTESEFRQFQANLLPENTLEYHEKRRLPAGTLREYYEGYEMVTIPAAVQDPSKLNRRIVLEEVMNEYEMKAFAGTKSLNPMQSAVFKAAFTSNENLLICAPTGAGKTNVAMLTVVKHLRDKGIIRNESDPYTVYQNANSGQGTAAQIGRKIVYIAPMKALAQEVTDKFSSKLKALGIVVRELTGDMQLSRMEAERADILVTTPEKWDVVTRKGGDGSLGQTCGLLIIDEVHLLADERGAVIESVVARLHRLVESSQRQVRIVGLSATLPNYKDVAEFLRVDQRRGLFHFGPEHRPVPLQQQFVGVTETKNRFKKEQIMNDICYKIVSDSLRRGYQVMVFVHSRRGTGDTIEALTEIAQKRNELEQLFITKGSEDHSDAHSRYSDRAEKSRNRELSKHFRNGMGIHHAGMLRADRKLTEQMFSDGAIKVLCCTATLAWGINLPAHTVVVKGTEVYNPEKGGAVDLSILDVQQIFGRAGRPQFDTSGEATLITTQDALARYLDKLVSDVPIESSFIKQLADHLNAEIANSTVTTLKEAAEWLQYTYLHVRMTKNPIAYGINAAEMESDPLLSNRSLELVKEASKTLDSYKMIRYDVASGNLSVTDLGRVASQFYIRAESVSRFNEMLQRNVSPSDADLVSIICNAHEFENVKVRPEELDEIDRLKKENCPLGVKIPVEEFSGKCSVLIQSYISCAKVNSFTLISDTNYIASNAGRVARALFGK